MPNFLCARSTSHTSHKKSCVDPLHREATTPWSQIGARALQIASCALLASCLSASAATAFDLQRPLDHGGHIRDYMGRITEQAGRRHVIEGDCMSACTLWLGQKGTCVTPDAVLWFHAATDVTQSMRNTNPWRTISAAGNQTLLANYPPRLRAVVAPWLESPDYHTLTGLEVAALGVPLCGKRDMAGG